MKIALYTGTEDPKFFINAIENNSIPYKNNISIKINPARGEQYDMAIAFSQTNDLDKITEKFKNKPRFFINNEHNNNYEDNQPLTEEIINQRLDKLHEAATKGFELIHPDNAIEELGYKIIEHYLDLTNNN